MKRSLVALLLCLGGLAGCDREKAPPYAEVDAALKARDFSRAAQLLEGLRAEIGAEPELMQRLGYAYELQKDLSNAVIAYKAGIDAHPEAGRLWVALGNLYLELKQFPRAKESLLKGRELGVEDRFTAFSLGICLGQMRELAQAEAEFERARAAGVDENNIRYNLALVRVADSRYRDAEELLQRVVDEQPTNHAAVRELANVLLVTRGKEPAEVDRILKMAFQVVDAEPEEWRAHMLLGDAFMAGEDYEAAVEAYTKALEKGKNPPEVEAKYVEAATQLKRLKAPSAPAAGDN